MDYSLTRLGFSALVTNCSAQKSAQFASELTSTSLAAGNQDVVAKQWIAKVRRAPVAAKVSDLYAGRGVKRMQRLALQLNVELYVASAGLGLLKANNMVPSYDLSVSSGNSSAVQHRIIGGFVAQDWWRSVQQSGYACPVADLFNKEQERDFVVLAISSAYVPLVVDDLLKLPQTQRDRLRLFGASDAKYPSVLRPFLMPYDSRLDVLVRGSKVDFAQRAAEHFIVGSSTDDKFPTRLDEQRRWVEASLSPVKAKARHKRETVDDAQIRRIAITMVAQGLSYTHALNTLRRQHGIACEQSRFRRLFLEVAR